MGRWFHLLVGGRLRSIYIYVNVSFRMFDRLSATFLVSLGPKLEQSRTNPPVTQVDFEGMRTTKPSVVDVWSNRGCLHKLVMLTFCEKLSQIYSWIERPLH